MVPLGPVGRWMSLAILLGSTPLPGLAQTCPDPGSYCEGWSRDISRREVSLSLQAVCNSGTCAATCSTTPIVALPSIRIGTLDHVVLGFAVSDACPPECPSLPNPEPCYNVGVSYRYAVDSGSESIVGSYDCDPSDPGTVVSSGATFSATYQAGGTDNIVISNIVYGIGSGPDDCGSPPTALDLTGAGPTLGVQSHFTFSWSANQVVGYTETRKYTAVANPNTVIISVTNIDYALGTYTASAPGASTYARAQTWGSVKIRYR
jgi:hypothetical protein